ncbi:Uncharacterised protein [uncultured archaeon]|nr:Uncharacterised protein [uncultured archaeon]
MKALPVLVVLLLMMTFGLGAGLGEDGPHLEVSSISGHLDLERPSVLTIQLFNNASALAPAKDAEFDARKGDAMGVVAAMQSSDDRITVLSGPQVAGTLIPGESRSLEFTLLAEGAEVGIYPLQLRLNYSWLSGVAVSGDKSLPDVVFQYEYAAHEMPLQAKAVQGPKIKLEGRKGEAFPGEESELQLILANLGDEPALNLQVKAYPQTPFSSVEIEEKPTRIDPDGFAAVKLKVLTEDNATSGTFALPCKIVYGEGNQRREDLAVLVSVKRAGLFGWLLPGAVLLLLLAGGYLGTRRYLSSRKRSRRRL